MNYLSDNVPCIVNHQQARLAILVEEGHIIFFYRSHKSGVFSDALTLAGGAVGVILPPVAAIPAFVGYAVCSLIDKLDKPNLLVAVNNIKTKFSLSDDEIFISHPQKCSVELSKNNSLINPKCTVLIKGVFIAGNKEEEYNIGLTFASRANTAVKIFDKGNFPVSFSAFNRDYGDGYRLSKKMDREISNVIKDRLGDVDSTKITWCKNCVHFTVVIGWEDIEKGYWKAPLMPTENNIPCKNFVMARHVWETFYNADRGKRTLYPKECSQFVARN